MGAEPLERKLAAILYADVAGYSRLARTACLPRYRLLNSPYCCRQLQRD